MEARLDAVERKLENLEAGLVKYTRMTDQQKEDFADAVQKGMAELTVGLGTTINDARAEFAEIREGLTSLYGQASSAVAELRSRLEVVETREFGGDGAGTGKGGGKGCICQ